MSISEGIGALMGAALLCTALTVILKSFGAKGAGLVAALSVCAFLSVGASGIQRIFEEVLDVSYSSGISEYAKAAAKIIGVGYLSSAVSDVCTELGECGIAKAFSASVAVEMMLIALPYFIDILKMGTELAGAYGV